jgi:hypothetical protein
MIRSPSGAVGYLPDIVQEIKGRYSFLSAPRDEDLVPSDPPKGAEFRHGKLMADDRVIVIDKFTIFNDGVVVDAASSTQDTDAFLTDLAAWAKTALPKAVSSGPRYYLSQIEIRMDTPLQARAPSFQPIGEKVSALLKGYGILPIPNYEVTTIQVGFDHLGRVEPQPGVFFIDRRLNVPYSENIWFAQAPLKTMDHIALLKDLEN